MAYTALESQDNESQVNFCKFLFSLRSKSGCLPPSCFPTHIGSSPNQGPFVGPQNVRHPYKQDPKRDPNLENYPHKGCLAIRDPGRHLSIVSYTFETQGARVSETPALLLLQLYEWRLFLQRSTMPSLPLKKLGLGFGFRV